MRIDETVPEVVCTQQEYNILTLLSNLNDDEVMWEYCNRRLGFNFLDRLNEIAPEGTLTIRVEEDIDE